VRLRIRNPYPPYPPAPEGVPNAYWTADLASYQTVVRYLLNSLRDDLVRAKVPEESFRRRPSWLKQHRRGSRVTGMHLCQKQMRPGASLASRRLPGAS
jgi:hypothetical protein